MKKYLAVAVIAVGVAAAQQTVLPRKARPASSPPPHLLMEQLSRMSPEERGVLLKRLPADRRSLLEDRLRKYSEMPEPVKKRMRDEYNVFQQLPSEKQEEMRKLFRQLGDFPEDRRPEIRKELVRLRNMPAERREKRMKSPRFREEFNEQERQFLGSLTDLLARSSAPSN